MKKAFKKILLGVGIFLASLVLTVGILALIGNLYANRQHASDIPAHVDVTPNQYGTVVTVGRGLYIYYI